MVNTLGGLKATSKKNDWKGGKKGIALQVRKPGRGRSGGSAG